MPLVSPHATWRQAFLELARDHARAGEDRYQLARRDFRAYLRQLAARAHRGAHGRLAQQELWFEHEGALVGTIRIRPRLPPDLRDRIGHIGYTIGPSQRGRGLGTRMLGLGLVEARAHGLAEVCLTVEPDNASSIRVIERNGGRWDGQPAQPRLRYWIGQPVSP